MARFVAAIMFVATVFSFGVVLGQKCMLKQNAECPDLCSDTDLWDAEYVEGVIVTGPIADFSCIANIEHIKVRAHPSESWSHSTFARLHSFSGSAYYLKTHNAYILNNTKAEC